MTNRPTNPYHQDTPEWQLWAHAEGCDHAAAAFHADHERFLAKAVAKRQEAARFRKALADLEAGHAALRDGGEK